MRRREFIAGLASTAVWPVVAQAQQPAVPVIGFLSHQATLDDGYMNSTVLFLQGLKETGYVEGQNVAIDYRYWGDQDDRLPALVADLVRRRVAVIVAAGVAQRWRRKQRPLPYRSSLPPALTQSHWVLSPASTGPAGTSPAAPVYWMSSRRNDCNCSAS